MKARRTLLPYALLLVVPAVVLAGFGWRSVEHEDHARREDARRRAEAEARRWVDEEADALDAIRAREERRPYFQYQAKYMPEDAVGLSGAAFVDSPLTAPPDDPRIQGWFQWTLSLGVVAGPDAFGPGAEAVRKVATATFGDALRGQLERAPKDPHLASAPVQSLTVQAVAANEEVGQLLEEVLLANATNRSTNYLDNFRSRTQGPTQKADAATAAVERIDVRTTGFRYLLPPESASTGAAVPPMVAAWRMVWIPGNAAVSQRGAPRDRWLVQGYLLDATRFFAASTSRSASDLIVRRAAATERVGEGEGDPRASASLFDRLDLGEQRATLPKDPLRRLSGWPALHVVATPDVRALDDERRASAIRYLSILGGLVAVVAIGMFVLSRSVRREVALAERKQDFVAAVTHELKTPLAGIRMYADMLKEGWVPEGGSVAEYAGRIAGETQRLSSLVDQVLDFAALERGVGTFRPTPGDLGEAVRSAVALSEPAAAEAGVPVRVEVEAGLPLVPFDPALVRSLVVNLVDNAIKYSAKSETKDVLASVRRAGGAVEVVVADRGPGIEKADQARLFEPFSRGGREETRTARGVGLGLALVKRYADAHGAKVTLDSAPGRGTTVTVRFSA